MRGVVLLLLAAMSLVGCASATGQPSSRWAHLQLRYRQRRHAD
ncbi:MAG: hypothetical protein WCD51_14040 [Anaerolineae bacterium]